MTSNIDRRCDPPFPAREVLLDNSALVRFWKCNALARLACAVGIRVVDQVAREFRKQGPAARAALDRLNVQIDRVVLGSSEWAAFASIRGGQASTRDLGDDESLAVAIARAERGQPLPLVTYDRHAGAEADRAGIVTVDFVDSLAWLLGCGLATADEVNEIEREARAIDGWKPHIGFTSVEAERVRRQARLVEGFTASRQQRR